MRAPFVPTFTGRSRRFAGREALAEINPVATRLRTAAFTVFAAPTA
jgi:hypothetical protein